MERDGGESGAQDRSSAVRVLSVSNRCISIRRSSLWRVSCRQLYVGAPVRTFVPVAQRKEVLDASVADVYKPKAGKKVAVRVQQTDSSS